MTPKNCLFSFSPELQQENAQYYDVAIAIYQIKKVLAKQIKIKSDSVFVFDASDVVDEVDNILEEDLIHCPEQVYSLSTVFDCLETYTVNNKQQISSSLYEVRPSLMNHVYYYPSFEVGYCSIPIFQAHEDYPHTYLFAGNKHAIERFMQYVQKRQREVMQSYINIFVDTEDGVERKKEKANQFVQLEDVLLHPELKQEIFRFVEQFFTDGGEFYKDHSIPYKRGILLYGKPGNGKTTLVKSIASTVEAPIIYWQITEFTSSYTIDEVFTVTSLLSPCILIIEDIDSMPDAVRSYFLNTLDGTSSKEGCFLIGTTNYPEKIDPALINRAGRFDRAYEFELPNEELRQKYLEKKGLHNLISSADFVQVVSMTKDFSFAQLNELYVQFVLLWHYEPTIPIQDIVSRLKTDVKKSINHTWGQDVSSRVGFFTQ